MLIGLFSPISTEIAKTFTVVYKGELPSTLVKKGVKSIQPKIYHVARELIHSQGIIIGGGTHFHDDYVLTRYLRHFRYMLRFVGLSIFAKMLQRKVLWLSMGFGPFNRTSSKWLTKMGLRSCDYVTTRDSKSEYIVAQWLPTDKLKRSFDLAALLLKNEGLDLNNWSDDFQKFNITIGVSITSVKNAHSGGINVDNLFWNHFESALLSILEQNIDVNICLFVFRGGERESDYEVSDKLFQAISSSYPSRIEIQPYTQDPRDVLIKISECDRFIATRFHSGVFSYLAGCEILFLAYHQKLIDLASEIGLPSHAVLEISDKITTVDIQERVNELISLPRNFTPTLHQDEAVKRAMINIDTIQLFS